VHLLLADDPQLLQMMSEANFFAVFIGIESPNTDTLISMQKKQNTRRNLVDSVHRIYQAGMLVIAGFIVGFDTEKASVADEMIDCIEATSIPVAMVGLLTALPNTQLTRRLEKAGRLLPSKEGMGDESSARLNFTTLRPRHDVLADFRDVLKSIYNPKSYFERVRTLGRLIARPSLPQKFRLRKALHELGVLFRLLREMTFRRSDVRRLFWSTIVECARYNPRNLEPVLAMTAYYLHLGIFAEFLIKDLEREIRAIDEEFSPQRAA
jgi:radical SAM superfamily enzyme YgiQ (UPF0313 family)